MKRRLTAILLVVCMIFSLLPAYASAEDDTTTPVESVAEPVNGPGEATEETVTVKGESAPAPTLLSAPEIENIPFIEADTETTVEITTGGDYAYFRYTPVHTDSYTFTSYANEDTYGYLYDANMNLLSANDDSGEGHNFLIMYTLEAGNTYILAVRYYSSDYTGTFPVILKINQPYGTCGENLTWYLDGTGTLTISGSGAMYDYGWGDAPWYEYRDEIIAVEIQNGVTSIGTYTFYKCISLTSIDIPDGVTSIGQGAFNECSSLTSIDIPDGVTYIGDSVFDGCSSLTSIDIPDGVTSIGNSAFYKCSSLTSIDLPDSVTSISDFAFSYCSSLTSIDLPDGLMFVDDSAFMGCTELSGIYVSTNSANFSNDENGVLFNKDKTVLVTAPKTMQSYAVPETVTDIGNNAFSYCIRLTSIDLPDGVTSIGNYAFYWCSSLSSIDLPDSVTSIGDWAFRGCSSLTSIDLPDGLTSIGNYVFYNCSSLSNIDLPDSVTSIGDGAFGGCSSLTSIDLPDGLMFVDGSAFEGCTELSGIYVSTNSANFSNDENGVLFNKDKTVLVAAPKTMQSYTIPETVTDIGNYAFSSCIRLTSIDIPDGVTSIGGYAFYYCENLTIITFTGNAPVLYDWAFYAVTATAYYPAGNETWTEEVMQDYGGNITWVAMGDPVGLEIISVPTSGIVGENPDFSGLVVALVYSNGTQVPIAVSELTISEVDTTTAGRKTVTVAYGEFTAVFTYGVHEGEPAVTLDPSTYPESSHNYENSLDDTQTLTYPNASGLVLVFSEETYTESGYDFIYVYDGADNLIAQYCGYEASGVTVEVPGDTVKIRLTSDGSVNGYGYSFTRISTAGSIVHTGTEIVPAVEHTCTTDGRTEGIICDICGLHVNYSVIPAPGHSFNEDQVCAVCGWEFYAEGTCGDNLTWYLDGTGTLTISGSGAMYAYSYGDAPWYEYRDEIIAVEIQNGVTSIGTCAFSNCINLTNINIPEGVTSIGAFTFENCTSLTSIDIPDGVTYIGIGTFECCQSLSSIDLPDGVTSIYNSAFYECSSLTSIDIPDGLTYIGDSAFNGCSSLTSIDIPDGVTSIGNYVFDECSSLTSIDLPDGVTSIGDGAFGGCSSLTSIDLPDGVTSIGAGAFAYCSSLTSIDLPDGITSIAYAALQGCESLTSIDIPDGVTSIGDGAFYFCYSLSSIDLPDGLTSIGYSAFNDCISLSSIDLPDGVTFIGDNAFSFCISLTSIDIPDGITAIDRYTFSRCESLTSIDLPDGLTSIGEGAFSSCSSLSSIDLPDSVTSIGDYVFEGCKNLTVITFTGNAPAIYDEAFYTVTATACYPAGNETWTEEVMQDYGGTIAWVAYTPGCEHVWDNDCDAECNNCGYVRKITHQYGEDGVCIVCGYVPEILASGSCGENVSWRLDETGTLTISGEGTMYNYYDEYYDQYERAPWYIYRYEIVAVKIQDGVTSIGNYAFYYCSSLTSVDIPDSVTSIGNYAFDECRSLTNIDIPDSVTSIGYGAFYECSSLTSIDLPDSITSIGNYVFEYCQSLTSIDLPDSVTSIGNYAFSSCISLSSIDLPDSVTSIGDGAFYYCNSLTSIDLPDGVTSIGYRAFSCCSSLTSIDIPDGVTSIGDYAFYECSSLTSIDLPDGVTSIGGYAFYYCENLTIITFTGNAPAIYDEAFCGVTATAYYPAGNETWTEDVKQNYGGNITWEAYEVEDPEEPGTPTSGVCGENLTWVLDQNGVLTISGEGAMYDYNMNMPWSVSNVLSVVISDGVTSIGSGAFAFCSNMTSIAIPDSVTRIGDRAFVYSSLCSVTIPASVTSIEEMAFSMCGSLSEITFEGDAPTFGADVFSMDGVEGEYLLTAYYPAGNTTWTADVMQDYGNGRSVTWVAVGDIPEYIPGDINGDGKVNNRDAARLMQMLAGWDVEYVEAALDVNGDGKVNNRDAARLMQYLAGWDVEIN